MTPNRSLELSIRIKDIMRQDILQCIDPIFPFGAVRSYESKSEIQHRDRVFNHESTLLTMVITALKEDRSLQNSVRIFQEVFHKNREAALQAAIKTQRELKQSVTSSADKSSPNQQISKENIRIPISKFKDLSSNTAAFSKARKRVEQGLIDTVFKSSTDSSGMDCVHKWHDRLVFNTDGTYFQMQDTPGIPEKYRVQKNADGTMQGYPQGLLQVLTQHGTGFISNYRIFGRSESELDAIVEMLDLPEQSLILADDLYNCYTLFCLLMERGIDVIVPDKKERPYRVVKQIAPGDEIVEISKPHHKIRLLIEGQVLPSTIQLRRISYKDPEHPEEQRVLLTTIFDETIERQEFIHKFHTRWDIEVSIREIKTIMGINIARSKTEEMVFREIGVALLAYNLVRKIVAKSASQTPFSPETDLFQKLYSTYTPSLVDRKGRVYSRWSPGRPPADHLQAKGESNPTSTRQAVSKEDKNRCV
jgi:Transposase DDE domain